MPHRSIPLLTATVLAAMLSPALAQETAPSETEEVAKEAATPDPELVAAGETVFRKCKACHQVGEGAKNRVGPVLNGVIGHVAGSVEDYRYSGAMEALHEEGAVWTEETLAEFLRAPRSYLKGTKMSFAGLRKDEDIAAVIAYLQASAAE
jgi:S-disulfanyl-L-cysteine oxidoreductase SoxD